MNQDQDLVVIEAPAEVVRALRPDRVEAVGVGFQKPTVEALAAIADEAEKQVSAGNKLTAIGAAFSAIERECNRYQAFCARNFDPAKRRDVGIECLRRAAAHAYQFMAAEAPYPLNPVVE